MRPKPLERHVWKRLARDTRGVAAIEFAFLAPVLIVMYFAMVEYCQAYMALKRTDHVAAMVADLTSQNDKFVKSQIEDVFAIGDVIDGLCVVDRAVCDRVGGVRSRERRDHPHIDGRAAGAVVLEQDHAIAQFRLESRLVETPCVRLPRADEAAAFHGRRLQNGVQDEDDPQLQDREDHQEEGNGDHGELHGRRAFAPSLGARGP